MRINKYDLDYIIELDVINKLADIYLELNNPTKAVEYLVQVISIEYKKNTKNM